MLQKKPRHPVVGFRCDPDLYRVLKKRAEYEGCHIQTLLRHAVELVLDEVAERGKYLER